MWLLKPLTESENSLILVRVDGPLFPTDIPALRAALDEVERIAREWQADSDGSEEAQS